MVYKRCFVLTFILLLFSSNALALEQSRRGKSHLGIAVAYDISSLEPLAVNEPVSRIVMSNIADSLLQKEGDTFSLDVATAYSSSESDKVWKVTLPREVYFSEGSSLRALSIVELYKFYKQRAENMLSDAALPTGVPAVLLKQLTNIKTITFKRHEIGSTRAIEEEVVVFELVKEDASFKEVLTLPILDMRVLASFGERKLAATNIAALGPFVVASNVASQGLTLDKSQNYFRSGFPQLDSIEIRQFVDADQSLSALRVGSVDIILTPTPKMLAQVEKDPTLMAIPSPLSNINYSSLSWQLQNKFWSEEVPQDKLLVEKIVIRKSLLLDSAALKRFNLSSVYVP